MLLNYSISRAYDLSSYKLSEKYTGNPVYQARGASGIDRQMIVIEAVKINGR
jgi:hypothetical protein